MPLLSIQEMVQKTEKQRKDITRAMDSGRIFDYSEANLFRSPEANDVEHGALGKEDAANIRETLRAVPLREFMAKSGSTGIAGAAYLIPDKIHTTLFDASVGTDLVGELSIAIVTDIPGSSLKVDVGKDGSYVCHDASSGGKFPDEEIEVVTATITPTLFGIALRITNDMIEDANPQWDLVDWHIRTAGAEIGDTATNKAIQVLKTGTDGDGTVNTQAAYADETTTVTINSCVRMVAADEWMPDTMLGTTEAYLHSIYFPRATTVDSGALYMAYASAFAEAKLRAQAGGWKPAAYPPIFNLNPIECQSPQLYSAVTSNIMTNCITVVFDKSQALLTGRKRWIRIEKYSDPIRDLVGAVVTSRQDSVTVYNDSICVATET